MACTDVQTIQAGNGTKTQFSFDFPYIFKSEIHVYFWNAVTKEYDEKLTTDATYPWRITDANPTIVEFTGTAPPSPATPTDPGEPTVDNVKIRRITKVDDIRALFNPGSAIRSDDLNKNFEQLRYAIQEANCAGIPDDVDAYLKNYYWNKFDETVYSTETWDSDDDQVATTQAIDARIDSKIDSALTVDIEGADGILVTDDTPGSGQITIGLSDNAVDFDKIKDADQIKLADQEADYDNGGSDDKVFTSIAAIRRFENFVQDSTPSTTAGMGKGRVWVDIAADKTLSVWDGNAWLPITSGGTFSEQPKVVYVDATAGNDSNDGHRISRPKATIKAAINQINADATYGDGSIVVVAPGVYQEECPIQIQKRDVAVVGTAVRQCVIHPTQATETATMFEVNSGTYLQNLTFTGMKASGTRGASGSLWENSTYGLPPTQGWNVAFYNNAYIYKSPYIQNCTNFSDSEIDNTDLNFYAGDSDKGRAGDLDSAPTGGGLLVDGSVPHQDSPLRSIVCDSYTHTGLDAPGIFVTNNGYVQATSSYAFFNHAHITCINGGQANLAASTSDFGRYGLIASGKSTTAIFTSTIDGAVSDGATTFNIDAPTAGTGWHGSATRPSGNMLVTVNSVTYPILSAVANGSGWTVTISRPDPNNRSTNLGVNGAISDGAAVSFFLRSMIASSGHTMEYVGSGTNYSALPENGGVPNDANQKVELDNGKIWIATTDQNGKFTVGGNQTDQPFFEVDQQLGFVTIPEGSISFNLLSDASPQLGGNLDVNGNEIVSTSNGDITLNPHGTGDVVLDAKVGIGTSNPSRKLEVTDSNESPLRINTTASGCNLRLVNSSSSIGSGEPRLGSTGDSLLFQSGGSEHFRISSNGDVGIGTTNPTTALDVARAGSNSILRLNRTDAATAGALRIVSGDTSNIIQSEGSGKPLLLSTNAIERVRIGGDGNVGIGTSNPTSDLHIRGSSANIRLEPTADTQTCRYQFATTDGTIVSTLQGGGSLGSAFRFVEGSTESVRITGGKVGIGTTDPIQLLHLEDSEPIIRLQDSDGTNQFTTIRHAGSNTYYDSRNDTGAGAHIFRLYNGTTQEERMRIHNNGFVGIGTGTPSYHLHVAGSNSNVARVQSTGNASAFLTLASNTTTQAPGVGANANDLMFNTAFNERMRIQADGDVGIGTSTPQAKLDVKGNAHFGNATGPAFVEIGKGATEDRFAYLDFVGDTTYTDYGFRILRENSGANTNTSLRHKGTGTLSLVTEEAGSINLSTANTTRMTIDAGGSVGIGTATPLQLLHVNQPTAAAFATLRLSNADGVGLNIAARPTEDVSLVATRVTDDILFTTGGSETLRITSGSRVGIGTTSPSEKLHVTNGNVKTSNGYLFGSTSSYLYEGANNVVNIRVGADGPYAEFIDAGSGALEFGNTGGELRLTSAGTERVRIDNAGHLLLASAWTAAAPGPGVGNTDTGTRLENATDGGSVIVSRSIDACLFVNRNANGDIVKFSRSGTQVGSISVTTSTTSYNTSSDYRLKENVVDLDGAITRVKQLAPKRFNFITDANTTVDGFLAHEAQTVVPEAVTGTHNEVDADGNAVMQGIDQSKLVPLLTAALKEAIAKIETLETKVAALEAG